MNTENGTFSQTEGFQYENTEHPKNDNIVLQAHRPPQKGAAGGENIENIMEKLRFLTKINFLKV